MPRSKTLVLSERSEHDVNQRVDDPIGGGMILGPLLLELGVNPRVSAPITHYMVLFTSSMTVIQFAIIGQLLPGHAAWFGGLCLVRRLDWTNWITLHAYYSRVIRCSSF